MSAAVDILGSVEIVRDGDFPAASVKHRYSADCGAPGGARDRARHSGAARW